MWEFSGGCRAFRRAWRMGTSGRAVLSRGVALGSFGRRIFGELALFVAVGFAAQLIDGAISARRTACSLTSVLLSFGIPPATASASVHVAEVFATGASGLAHWRMGNVRPDLVLRLAVPGALGGVLGAYRLSAAPTGAMRVGVSLYLMGLGALILLKALRPRPPAELPPRQTGLLGFWGGALDAIGGGGWGAIVTSTLIGSGGVPRTAIGSASLAEFFVSAAISAAFAVVIGVSLCPVILELVAGRAGRGAPGATAARPAADGGRGRGGVAVGAPERAMTRGCVGRGGVVVRQRIEQTIEWTGSLDQ